MSGALIELVAKGLQDAYITSEEGASFFKVKYSRHTNFAQAPKKIADVVGVSNTTTSVKVPSLGDLINHVWLESDNITDYLSGTTFDLFIGGQKIDSQTYDFMAEIWQVYMAETSTKSQTINNTISQSNKNFFPLHFFFCDCGMFLPLLAIQYHEVEIQIHWGSTPPTNVKVYGNYVYLDTAERGTMVNKSLELMITQVQRMEFDNSVGHVDLDIGVFLNHPIKSLYFGYEAENPLINRDYLTFTGADLQLNGTYVFEDMSPTYFHTVQSYYNCPFGLTNLDNIYTCPVYTRYYTYNFCLDASSYKPTGTCNFSRIDNAKLTIHGLSKASERLSSTLKVYAVGYNILKIERGLAGILFGN